MKKYIVEVFVAAQKVKQYVVDSMAIAETIADTISDEVIETRIKEVVVG
jgi:hypothetical protein